MVAESTDPSALDRAKDLTARTLGWFPVRVWRRFLQRNGFLLAAGISYQALFAIFAALSLSFAIAGIWLGGSPRAVDGLIRLVNGYIPNLISDHGLVTPAAVESIATQARGLLGVTGAIAGIVLIWTAIGFVTYTRRAVRNIFGLPFDQRAYVLLKARDLLAAILFGIALVLGAALGQLAGGAIDWVFGLFGLPDQSFWVGLSGRLISLAVAFLINGLALAGLYRLLAGTSLHWGRIWPGSLLGGAALAVIQFGAGLLLFYTPSNPLLATFTVFIGFLLLFRLIGIVILVASAWIAVSAEDRNLPLARPTEAEIRAEEHAALILAATVRLREARRSLAAASWYQRPLAQRELREAERHLGEVDSGVGAHG